MKPTDKFAKPKAAKTIAVRGDERARRVSSLDEQVQRAFAANTRTLVIVPNFSDDLQTDDMPLRDPSARREEAVGLAHAIDLTVVESEIIRVSKIRPATLFASGKLEQLKTTIKLHDIDLVIVDHPLSPGQQRNLERAWGAKVLDRTGLILEIFGRRARTAEGRLQVELAHLSWQKSRLVRSWTHLERQRGGFGFLGGPGETQIEADRRMIEERITAIKRRLEKIRRTRALHRESRERVPYPVVALVGYTNAGKSTLFNTLTGAGVMAKDQLFATLDPTMRELVLPGGLKVILSDTVGFISALPTTLIAAFRATLEEVTAADVILHVRDMANQDSAAQKDNVLEVLRELQIDPEDREVRLIEVWNKIDLLDPAARQALLAQAARMGSDVVAVSAVTGEGLETLTRRLADVVSTGFQLFTIVVPPAAGGFVNWLYENAEVVSRSTSSLGEGILSVRVPRHKILALHRKITKTGSRFSDSSEHQHDEGGGP